jgi:hypothetical protein
MGSASVSSINVRQSVRRLFPKVIVSISLPQKKFEARGSPDMAEEWCADFRPGMNELIKRKGVI